MSASSRSADPRAVTVVGRGRVGRSFAAAARAAGVGVRLVAGRRAARIAPTDLVVLCVPDAAVLEVASLLPDTTDLPRAVVHTAGVLAADYLAPLRARGWSVEQAHPLAAIATPRTALHGIVLLAGGDLLATRRASGFARRVGMRPVVLPDLDRRLWHAVAALVANGASTLASLGAEAWIRAGVPAPVAQQALAGLLASVARNVAAVGTPAALTGPVRRGDFGAVTRHLDALAAADASGLVGQLYASLALAQVGLAARLGEADGDALKRIASVARAAMPRQGERAAGRPR